MMNHHKRTLSAAGLLLSAGALTLAAPAFAQTNAPVQKATPTVVYKTLNLFGRGPRVYKLHVLTPRREPMNEHSRVSSDAILFTNRYDYDQYPDTPSFLAPDPLFSFPGFAPTVGSTTPAPNRRSFFSSITVDPDSGNTVFGAPTAYKTNTLEDTSADPTLPHEYWIAPASTGAPALLTTIAFAGGLANVKTKAPSDGAIIVIFFNGVTADPTDITEGNANSVTPDPSTNQAKTEGGFDGYELVFHGNSQTQGGFGFWGFDNNNPANGAPDRLPITDPHGNFAMLVAKISDPANITSTLSDQWLWAYNAPIGPNAAYQGDSVAQTINTQAVSIPGDSTGKVTDVLNFSFSVRGVKPNGTAFNFGAVGGNLRRRGVYPPSTTTPEGKSAFYEIDSFVHSTGALFRKDYVFTQPSYKSDKTLSKNYRLNGFISGTYDFVIKQLPIATGLDSNGLATGIDVLFDYTVYPFADFYPHRVNSVVVPTSGGEVTLNTRQERLGDIDDGANDDTVYHPDGIVDLNDLVTLANDFGLTGAIHFVTGDILGNPTSGPDGKVNLDDLVGVADEFGQGKLEPGAPYGP